MTMLTHHQIISLYQLYYKIMYINGNGKPLESDHGYIPRPIRFWGRSPLRICWSCTRWTHLPMFQTARVPTQRSCISTRVGGAEILRRVLHWHTCLLVLGVRREVREVEREGRLRWRGRGRGRWKYIGRGWKVLRCLTLTRLLTESKFTPVR